MSQLLLFGLIASLFSLVGGLLVIWRAEAVKKIMTLILAFSAGAFIAAAFLDILPEAVEMVEEPHNVFYAFLVGLTSFFILERFLMRYFPHHGHGEHADHTESLPILVVIGDTLHNFLDGVVIGIAYVANPALGLTTAAAIAAHEIPQEIGDFAVLLDQGWSKLRIIMVNVVSAALALVGVLVGYGAAASFESVLPYLLASVAGIFAYIGLSDLIPEIHHRSKHEIFFRVILAFVTGLALVGYLIYITHE